MTQTTLNPLIGSISKVHFFRQSYTPISELNPKRYYPKNSFTDTIIAIYFRFLIRFTKLN